MRWSLHWTSSIPILGATTQFKYSCESRELSVEHTIAKRCSQLWLACVCWQTRTSDIFNSAIFTSKNWSLQNCVGFICTYDTSETQDAAFPTYLKIFQIEIQVLLLDFHYIAIRCENTMLKCAEATNSRSRVRTYLWYTLNMYSFISCTTIGREGAFTLMRCGQRIFTMFTLTTVGHPSHQGIRLMLLLPQPLKGEYLSDSKVTTLESPSRSQSKRVLLKILCCKQPASIITLSFG